MMAAVTAGATRRVALIDRNPQLGRKLLATGNGRCNLTNSQLSIERYHGADPRFIEAVLGRFDQRATMSFFEDLGLLLKEEDGGRVFPRTNQASSVVEVLRQALAERKVDLLPESLVVDIQKPSRWVISLNDGHAVHSDKLIIATGGKAAHQFGSTGDGYQWAKKLGHSITPYHAALVPVETVEQWPAECQGVKVEARVWATGGGESTAPTTGDVLFTDYGVSGPAVMSQARGIAVMLKTAAPTLHIDLFPDFTAQELPKVIPLHSGGARGGSGGQHPTSPLFRGGQGGFSRTAADALAGLLPSGLIPIVLRLAGSADAGSLAGLLKDLTLTVSKLRPYKEAQVTTGGVSTDEVAPETLESRLVPSLYFAGEVLDCDGDSGGFNLQWAWSSGYVAGLAASATR
jgi:hypothetical protein